MSDKQTDNPDWSDTEARENPVQSPVCIWCKCEPEGNLTTTLTTGERLCEHCLGDLREWKRTRFADLLVAPSLEQSIRSALLDDWQDMMGMLAQIHDTDPKLKTLPSRTSNSNEHREHGDDAGGSTGD